MTSFYSSVGRASDCRALQLSDGPWFDCGWPDLQMWEAGQGGVCASDAAFLCSSNCCSLAILFTNLFANLFANLFRYSREESGRLKKERLHVSCLMSLCASVFSFFIKNLQMPLKQVCK